MDNLNRWSLLTLKNFDHDHGQNLKMTMIKWSKIMTLLRFQYYRGQMVKIYGYDICQDGNLTVVKYLKIMIK